MKTLALTRTVLLSLAAMAGFASFCAADEIGFIERFALADDREEALKELIPGTEDYYFYHALHFQNLGELEKVDELLKPWVKRYNVTERVNEIRHRQALLRYEGDPKGTLDYLKRELNLPFNHRQRKLDEKPNLPTALDPKTILRERLLEDAFRRSKNLDQLEDGALNWVLRDRVQLTDVRRRHLLSRMSYPDYPNLVETVAAELRSKESRGFGEFEIHRRMLPEQLDELLGLRPELIDNTNFVHTYITKLHPGDDIDWQRDPATRGVYLEQLWDYVRELNPAFSSLQAHTLYRLLDHHRQEGRYPRDLFMAYIKYPRPVGYMNQDYLKRQENQRHRVDCNADFSEVTNFPPIGNDEPLVRESLMQYFLTAEGYGDFAPFIRDTYLKPVFAETKIVNGIGNQEKWFSMLSPSAYQVLKERVDLDFASTNPREFDPGDEVVLDVYVKNVKDLLVKVYEINALNYYLENGQDLNTDLNLDGLIANRQFAEKYDDPSLRRVKRTFTFEDLKGKRGVWIVEFIGNGRSSRALVRQGKLQMLSETTSAGEVIRVLTKENGFAKDPAVWLGGRKFTPDKKGNIVVPFTTTPGRQPVILTDGDFATLDYLRHPDENYELTAGFHVDREDLLPGTEAEVAVRPMLKVNGRPVDLRVMEQVRLVVHSTDLEGVTSKDEVHDFELSAGRESLHTFRVPERLQQLRFVLSGEVRNLSKGTRDQLRAESSFELNAMDRSEFTGDLHLTMIGGEYILELLGKTGEALVDRPVHLYFKHRDFKQTANTSLQTGAQGRVKLGPLPDIVSFKADGPDFQEHEFRIPRDGSLPVTVVHGAAGGVVPVPLFIEGDAGLKPSDLAVLETRGGTPVKNWFDAATYEKGFLKLAGLPAGNYEVYLRGPEAKITVRLTEGENRDGYVLSRHRHLQVVNARPLQIREIDVAKEKIRIALENTNGATRVHAVATRFVPDYRIALDLGVVLYPGPREIRRGTAETRYVSGRDIGEEYRYILDRRAAAKFPGNMLERPGLLLNPWEVRTTETEVDEADKGEDWERSAEDKKSGVSFFGARASGQQGGARSSWPNINFLAGSAPISFNLTPDKNGVVELDRSALGDRQHLHVLALAPRNTVYRHVSIGEPAEFLVRDTRLPAALDPEKHFSEQKRVTMLDEGETLTIEDARSARLETYDTLAKVYGVLSAMSGDATLSEFAFVLDWPRMDEEKRLELYSKYACHELNVFLARKDPEFFEAVIEPYLRNKKDKTFIDEFLIGADLERYLEPWAYGRLNTVERILLARRLGGGEVAATKRHVQDLYDLIPPDPERDSFGFLSALRGRGLSRGAGVGGAGLADMEGEMLREEMVDGFAATGGKARAGGRRALQLGAAMDAPAPAAKKEAGEAGSPSLASAEKAKSKMARMPAKLLKDDLVRARKKNGEKKAESPPPPPAEAANYAFIGAMFDVSEVDARGYARQFYRKLGETKEWAENNYYKLPIREQNAELITANGFWRDYAAWDGKGGFYSRHFTEATRHFAEMMLALAVLDVPFEAGEHEIAVKDGKLTLKAGSPLLVFHKEVREAEVAAEKTPILVSQNFFRYGDRHRMEGNEKSDKFVTEEFLAGVVYGAQVVVTNPTSATQKLELLLQVPAKAIPVMASDYTQSTNVRVEPYSTQQTEYDFYFPGPSGETPFAHQPVQISKGEKLIAWAEPFTFNVVKKLSRIDKASWDYVSQFASDAEVLAYLDENNVERLDLSLIAWRARERGDFLKKVIGKLGKRHAYDDTLWSYGIFHNALPVARQYLLHRDGFLNQCGAYIDTALVTIDPVARRQYEFLQYDPLVNARAHRLGKERKILNKVFRDQYLQFMRILSYRHELDDSDRLGTVYYLALQDRVEEALAFYDEVDAANLSNDLQYDYLSAYLAMCRENPAMALRIADEYADYPVDKWRERFANVAKQVDEIGGKPVGKGEEADPEDRELAQELLADTEPSFEFEVENRKVTLRYRNLKEVRVNYYDMDLEFLFSSNPFLTRDTGRFSFIRPNKSETKKLPGDKNTLAFDLPKEFGSSNVLVEIVGAGQKHAQPHYANELHVQLAENYGRLQVRHRGDDRPLGKVYVKVYARLPGGEVKFLKDGYTDLRGKFDYTSVSTDEADGAEKLSLLVMSEKFGSLVREADPPTQ